MLVIYTLNQKCLPSYNRKSLCAWWVLIHLFFVGLNFFIQIKAAKYINIGARDDTILINLVENNKNYILIDQIPIQHLSSIISVKNVQTTHYSVKHKPKVRVNQGLKSEVAESAVCWQWGGGLWSAHTNRHIQRAVNFIISPPLTTPPHHRSLTPHPEFTLLQHQKRSNYPARQQQHSTPTLLVNLPEPHWDESSREAKRKEKTPNYNTKKPKSTTPEKHYNHKQKYPR